MTIKYIVASLVGTMLLLRDPQRRDERGISQSAESAILLAGAVAVAIIVVGLITAFVRSKMAEI